mmetsp:Transcript_15585/g.25298  ORF Transcript_15585/g.25298 Transcript_15585/m.25298 type:complete len:210 (+) Transcript_15585:932-1561(+)
MLQITHNHQLQQITPNPPRERLVDIPTRQKVLEHKCQWTKGGHGFHESMHEIGALRSVGLLETDVNVDVVGGDGEFDEGDAGLFDDFQVREMFAIVLLLGPEFADFQLAANAEFIADGICKSMEGISGKIFLLVVIRFFGFSFCITVLFGFWKANYKVNVGTREAEACDLRSKRKYFALIFPAKSLMRQNSHPLHHLFPNLQFLLGRLH